MSRHRRLHKTMRNPARMSRRAKRQRRLAKYGGERPRAYLGRSLPRAALDALWGKAS